MTQEQGPASGCASLSNRPLLNVVLLGEAGQPGPGAWLLGPAWLPRSLRLAGTGWGPSREG